MHQHIVTNAQGIINTKQSLINALNALPVIKDRVIDFDIVYVHEAEKSFAIIFNQIAGARDFLAAHPSLGELDVTDEAHPKIILNKEDSFIYLFNTIFKTQELLRDPQVPPFARVNFLELFTIQALEPFIFYGPRQEEMKVGLYPIHFELGKLWVSLRGQVPGHNNTVILYNNFDELALICFTDALMAANFPALNKLVYSVRKQYVMTQFKGSDLDQRLSLQPLKVSSVTVDSMTKRLFIDVLNEKSQVGTLQQIRELKQLLQQLFGDSLKVITSLHYGRAKLEIKPVERFLFNDVDIELLGRVFQEKAEVMFLPSAKERLKGQTTLDALSLLQAEAGQVRYSFEQIYDLAKIFEDPVTYEVFNNPLVVDDSGLSFSGPTIQRLIDTGNRTNPLTRKPMAAVFRENKLLVALMEHYTRVPGHILPPLLDGITKAVILPDGNTYNKADVVKLFMEQNGISQDEIYAEIQATLGDGSVISWSDVWQNLAIQQLINFYNQSLTLNSDERVLLHANPMVSLAATISSLLDSPASISREDAEGLMESNPSALPVHVIWSSSPEGLRLNFKSTELERLILTLLTRNSIPAVSMDSMAPFSKCIFLNADTDIGKENIKKFLFDICKFNRESKYFDKYFSLGDFRYDSGTRSAKLRRVAAPSASEDVIAFAQSSSVCSAVAQEAVPYERLVLNFLRAMFYDTMAKVNEHYAALPPPLKFGYLRRAQYADCISSGDMSVVVRTASMPISARTPAAAYVASTHTPFSLLSHVAGVPAQPISTVEVAPPQVLEDRAPLVGSSPLSDFDFAPIHSLGLFSTPLSYPSAVPGADVAQEADTFFDDGAIPGPSVQ